MTTASQSEDSSSLMESTATAQKAENDASSLNGDSITIASEKEEPETMTGKVASDSPEIGEPSSPQEVQDIIPDRVFVGNLPYSVTEDQVRELTPDLKIVSVEIPKKTFFNRFMSQPVIQSKGYGFITYTSAEDATRAIEEITGKMISEREIYAKAAIPQSRNRIRHNNGSYNYGGSRGNFYPFNGYGGGYGRFYRYGYMPGGAPEMVDPHISPPASPEGMYNGNVYYANPAGGYYYPGVAPQPAPQMMGGFYGAPVMPFGAEYTSGYPENTEDGHAGPDQGPRSENLTENGSKEDKAGAEVGKELDGGAENGTEVRNGSHESVDAPRSGIPMMGLDMKMMQGMERRYNQPFRRQQKTKEEKLRKLQEGTPSKTTIFVGNLDRNVTVNDLREFFEDLEPQWIRVPRKTLPKYLYEKFKSQNIQIQNKGIAFVRFANEEKQKNAIEKLNGVEFRGKPLNVTIAIDSASDKTPDDTEKKQESRSNKEEASKADGAGEKASGGDEKKGKDL